MKAELVSFIIDMAFLLSASGFFVCLKLLSSPKTARRGNFIGAGAMLLATITTFAMERPSALLPIFLAIFLGSLVGVVSAKRVQMTAMPQMIAIFNGFGGLASVLVAIAEVVRLYFVHVNNPSVLFSVTAWFSVAVGAITFTGSTVAYLKLQEIMPTRPILVRGTRIVTIGLTLATFFALYLLLVDPKDMLVFFGLCVVASVLGILLVIPIGGADMPVVISLLNSYSGLAALAVGFVVKSNILIISGALVGASGVILTRLMCQAMNRSLMHVVFGAFGGVELSLAAGEEKPMREYSPM
ncbi:MAG TPA: NAD(P)(+) transhydrogenase (Re/Si-specific) subunit beta, partial [Myxococcota bacterium]|nr:NAD(P)(+) transhydrogenase (Re/Si-specific) subunit beta [Myxococcota bacterium]